MKVLSGLILKTEDNVPEGNLYEKIWGKNIFCILRVTEEWTRIRSLLRIHLYRSPDPDPHQKCHGSPTLQVKMFKNNNFMIHEFKISICFFRILILSVKFLSGF
jgi:hypothetical protein